MQIRLTVVDPQGASPGRGGAATRDVLVTAPTGTELAAVAPALASAVTGESGAGRDGGGAPVVLYAGTDRLDPRRHTLGEPPLVDGAVLSLGAPVAPESHPELDDAPTQLHVVAGPDAGGVHLLHGGRITVGRSADADVPLDDPDVSRLHCAVTVTAEGRVSVADLDSTNGTTLDGARVTGRPVRFPSGGLLRLGESALRVTPSGGPGARTRTVPDGEGCVRVPLGEDPDACPRQTTEPAPAPAAPDGPTGHAYGTADRIGAERVERAAVPEQGRAPRIESRAPDHLTGGYREHDTHAGHRPDDAHPDELDSPTRKGTPVRGTELPGRRRGIGAWARKLTGGRGEHLPAEEAPYAGAAPVAPPEAFRRPETWPDPAALLLTALGPGPRLWERGPGHREALAVRLGTADRTAPDGSALPAVPVTAALREVGALGLAGPRPRLAGLARAVLAQLAALHSPDLLEIVLISADRARSVAERTAEWSWLGWLPHVRPGHGQDCRLLLAYDREQAAARTGELLRRVESHADPASFRPGPDGHPGPYTVVVVDGDPGGSALREDVARLAVSGPRAGVHVVCLAETAPASPASPLTETYQAACAVTPTFRECGAVALLSGDVATAVRLMRVAPTGPVGPGTLAAVDAVSPAWAERFARALAPLRPDAPGDDRHARVAVPLPLSARLLDELGLARATPASLMARWADAADDTESLGGRARVVLGSGPRGPVTADLVADGPHLLVEGPPGSGRTELLRAVVASLAAAERPDRLGMVLIDGRDGVGTAAGAGEGLRPCTDIPHVTTHLIANDPVRMREFAQSLSAELKRRAELVGLTDFAHWHTAHEVSGRMVAQRGPGGRGSGNGDLEAPPSSTLRLRPGAARQHTEAAPPLPRLVVVVDDLDALVSPALGSPGRPAAGSVVRALEAVAREGERLGVHLVTATGTGGRTAETEPARRATLRVTLDAPSGGRGTGPAERSAEGEPAPGRGVLAYPDGRVTGVQGGRVTGRIPRTATQRPTVLPLDWQRMGDPPTRRPVRELGNGPTDLALLASAVERAARQVSAGQVPSLL
ncbi:FtsK/SpoIIIE family protein [Streptomyces sp. BK022]|uniref:FHA domain-containing protein n=1 Tax=Streptomyces sp. BK022 TaxID=2512123 RepID=UPI00102976FC|nr:FHA domain-containing protein [Streptomyces sp. BK022]RZU37193.1 FtsK/SpoIIIE family protein [Streptomyces sp. BK022]